MDHPRHISDESVAIRLLQTKHIFQLQALILIFPALCPFPVSREGDWGGDSRAQPDFGLIPAIALKRPNDY
jgi:hypothetical protein